jgi:hypothetical protein
MRTLTIAGNLTSNKWIVSRKYLLGLKNLNYQSGISFDLFLNIIKVKLCSLGYRQEEILLLN